MRLALLRFFFLACICLASLLVVAQSDETQRKLDSLKGKNLLTDWIYERLDVVTQHPQQRFLFLMQTQQKAWRKAQTAEEHYAWLNLLSMQGYYQLQQGEILASINSYESAFDYYRKNKVAAFEIVEYTLKPLSNNYTRLGDYERALFLQQKSVNFLLQNQGKPADIAAIYGNMAICYQSMGKPIEAEKNVAEGLKLANTEMLQISLNNTLANILFDKKEYAKALRLIEANINKQQHIDQEKAYWLMGSYTTAGNVQTVLGEHVKASQYFTKALALLDRYYQGSKIRERANLTTQLGHIKLLQQQPMIALQFFNKTLATLKISDKNGSVIHQRIYGDNKLMEVFEQMAMAYQQLKQPDLAINYIKLALLAGDKIRNEFADDQTKERLQADLKNIAERGIAISYQLFQQQQKKTLLLEILGFAEQSKSRTLLDQIYRNQKSMAFNQTDSLFIKKKNLELAITYNEKEELEGIKSTAKSTASLKYDLAMINKQIRHKYQQFNAENTNISTADLLAQLPSQRMLEYFVGQEAVYLIDIKNKQVNNVVRLSDVDHIKSAIQIYVNTYFQQGPSAMLNSPKEFYSASYQIYSSILQGISFEKGQNITIIPDGILGYISFDGLITNKQFTPTISNWPFLIKNNTITYAFSLQTLIAHRQKDKQKGFTGFFITHQQNNNAPLKAVQAEADGIQKLVKGQFLFNDEVSAKVFSREFGKNQVLHIGTHAYLSGKNQEPTLDFGKEKLFLFELAAQPKAPSLVVLSACRTADGLLANGEGIISLSRGFNAIGTSATIAGLWNVNDATASIITSNFYKYLLRGESNGNALHLAKIDWLNSPQTSDALYLPYYWDSLIYMGADQQTDLARPFHWILIAGIGLLAVGLVLGFILLRKKRVFAR